jgi:hypothetical protein
MSNITPITINANGITPIPSYYLEKVLGATTVDRGLVNVRPKYQDKVEIIRMSSTENSLHAPVLTPTTGVGNFSITNRLITLGDAMYYRTFSPIRDFENEYQWQYNRGKLTEAQLASITETAVKELATSDLAAGVETLIWNGDTTSGSAHLAITDGLIKQLDADTDGDLNNVTFGAVLTAANIIDKMQDMIDACPAAILEQVPIKFVVSYSDLQKLYSAYRDATITKGINLMDGGVPRFGGIPIVSCGIPENKMLLGVFDASQEGQLQAATWMNEDRSGLLIDRLQNNSELFFIKALFKWGINYRLGSEIVYGKQ